jgi:hypothetical protein
VALYLAYDEINTLSFMMYNHFGGANSSRTNIFINEGDFFRYAPLGMLVSFVGPTLSEMASSPANLIAGVEGVLILVFLIYLILRQLLRFLRYGQFNPTIIFPIMITVFGILFVHYPFGIFNPGSATRYRENFLFLFFILFLYMYIHEIQQKRTITR